MTTQTTTKCADTIMCTFRVERNADKHKESIAQHCKLVDDRPTVETSLKTYSPARNESIQRRGCVAALHLQPIVQIARHRAAILQDALLVFRAVHCDRCVCSFDAQMTTTTMSAALVCSRMHTTEKKPTHSKH